MEQIDRQNMYCHDCGKEFSVAIDTSLNGNHVFECPHCKHEHCRVVEDGVITAIRWAQRNGPPQDAGTYLAGSMTAIHYATTSATTINVNYTTNGTSSNFTTDAWANLSDTTGQIT